MWQPKLLTLSTLDNSLKAWTLLSAVAIWWITAIERTASILESRNGKAKLSQNMTSCSFSRAIWAKAWHRSEPILKMTGLIPRYFPLPQPEEKKRISRASNGKIFDLLIWFYPISAGKTPLLNRISPLWKTNKTPVKNWYWNNKSPAWIQPQLKKMNKYTIWIINSIYLL